MSGAASCPVIQHADSISCGVLREVLPLPPAMKIPVSPDRSFKPSFRAPQAGKGGANLRRDIDQHHVVETGRRCPFAMLGGGSDIRDGPAGEPAAEQPLTPMRQRSLGPHVLDDSETAAGSQKSSGFAIEGGLVGRVADAFDGPDDVEAGVRKRGVEIILLRKADPIRYASLQRKSPGALHLAANRGDPNHPGGEGPGKPDRAASHPAAGVEDSRSMGNADAGR